MMQTRLRHDGYARFNAGLDVALRVPPASATYSLLGVLFVCLLLALATWLGSEVREQSLAAPAADASSSSRHVLRLVDARRAVVFDANAQTGEVRVLNVRSGVAEIARLREPHRHSVSSIALDPTQRVLRVESDSGRYEYDTLSLHLLAYRPSLASNASAGSHAAANLD